MLKLVVLCCLWSLIIQQILKKNKMDLQKNENRRNARVLLEKQLQASIEGHITRTVESYTYYVNDSDGANTGNTNSSTVYVNAKLLLLHTFERMRIAHGKKSFKRFLLSEVSCSLFEEVFWLAFCHFYQKVSYSIYCTLEKLALSNSVIFHNIVEG